MKILETRNNLILEKLVSGYLKGEDPATFYKNVGEDLERSPDYLRAVFPLSKIREYIRKSKNDAKKL